MIEYGIKKGRRGITPLPDISDSDELPEVKDLPSIPSEDE